MKLFPSKGKTMVLTEAEALELFAFLLASARTQIDDPCSYASMRLLTAAEKLRQLIRERVSADTQSLFSDTDELSTHAQINMMDQDAYAADLDELCRLTAQYFVDQSEVQGGD